MNSLVMAAAVPLIVLLSLPAEAEELDERSMYRTAHVLHLQKKDKAALTPLEQSLKATRPSELVAQFKQLARQQSEDLGSAADGGDLGTVSEGTLEAAFEGAIFSASPMKLSAPVQSSHGWHLVLVLARTEQPVKEICRRTLLEGGASGLAPGLLELSLAFEPTAELHPRVLSYMPPGWGPPQSWGGNLAYWRVERDSQQPNRPTVVVHAELIYAAYKPADAACVRSRRYTYRVNCIARAVALEAFAQFEARAAQGRMLQDDLYQTPTFESARQGLLGQFARLACGE